MDTTPRPVSQDARYDRYAEIFENPVEAETLEVGNRVMHWQFMENSGSGASGIRRHAEQAQQEAQRRAQEV